MTSPNPESSVWRRFTDPIEVRPAGNVIEYQWTPNGPVRFSEVRLREVLVGWLWADDSADAAGYLFSAQHAPESANLGVPWELRLRNAKARGLAPSQALTEAAEDGSGEMGMAGPISDEAVPFEDLKALAGQLPPPTSGPRDRRR